MSEAVTKMLLFFGVMSLTGWVMMFVGLGGIREQRRREESEHTRATGRIADYVRRETHSKSGVRESWRPVIEFSADGQRYRLEYENSMSREEHPVGEEVEVLYDVSNPERFHLESDLAFSRGSGNMVRFGAIWIIFSAVLSLVLAMTVGGLRLDFHGFRAHVAPEKVESVEKDRVFQYQLQSDGTAVITDYDTGGESALVLPAMLDGHIVSGISGVPFSRALNITKLTVPGTISGVPMMSFIACVNLTDLTLGQGVRSVGARAFGECLSLAEVTLPDSLTAIADDAFPDGCSARFHVAKGSEAERYCLKKGYETVTDD